MDLPSNARPRPLVASVLSLPICPFPSVPLSPYSLFFFLLSFFFWSLVSFHLSLCFFCYSFSVSVGLHVGRARCYKNDLWRSRAVRGYHLDTSLLELSACPAQRRHMYVEERVTNCTRCATGHTTNAVLAECALVAECPHAPLLPNTPLQRRERGRCSTKRQRIW